MFVFASEFEICIWDDIESDIRLPGFDFKGTSEAYIEEAEGRSLLRGLPAETSLEELSGYFIDGLQYMEICDSRGKRKTKGNVGTGDYIDVLFQGASKGRAYVVVDGDVDGDGTVGPLDYFMVKRAVLGTLALPELPKAAAACTNGKTLEETDYFLIKRQVLGTYDLYEKYQREAPVYNRMNFTKTDENHYMLRFIYQGKPASLSLVRRSWGTWNLGAFVYDGVDITGHESTDWEYVFRTGTTAANATEFSGGNHGSERMRSFRIYDSATGAELDPKIGETVQTDGLKLVETTTLHLKAPDTDYCDVVRTYYLAGNRIELDVDFNYTRDIYHTLSYTCMLPVSKTHGQSIVYYNQDGSTRTWQTVPYGQCTNVMDKENPATKCRVSGPENPDWHFDVEIRTVRDSCDDFRNYDKTFFWDMNTTHNKLYFSRYDSGKATLVRKGTHYGTSSSWTFGVGE